MTVTKRTQIFAGLLAILFAYVGSNSPTHGQGASVSCEEQEFEPDPDDVKGQQDRVIEALPERAKELVVDSMMVLGYVITDDNGLEFEATRKFPELGGPSKTTGEKLFVKIEPSEQGAVRGSRVFVESKKRALLHKKWALAILDHVECLHDLLDTEPQRVADMQSMPPSIVLPDGTEVPLRLRRYLFSRNVKAGDLVEFQVADDILVNGVVVIERGASARGLVTDARKAKGFERAAGLSFSIESVKAVDGQEIPLRSDTTSLRGTNRIASSIIGTGVFGLLLKGDQVGVRAGSKLAAKVAKETVVTLRNE